MIPCAAEEFIGWALARVGHTADTEDGYRAAFADLYNRVGEAESYEVRLADDVCLSFACEFRSFRSTITVSVGGDYFTMIASVSMHLEVNHASIGDHYGDDCVVIASVWHVLSCYAEIDFTTAILALR